MADKEVQTVSSKLNGFMEKNRKGIVTIVITLFVLLIAFIVCSIVLNNVKNKNLAVIDEISYELTFGSSKVEESELKTRCETALEKIKPFTTKGGIVGARANMLAADITYDMEDYTSSVEYWKVVAAKGKKTYLEPIAYFNVGVCYEELGNIEEACEAYKTAAYSEGFVQKAHAKFSYARVLESQGKNEEAVAVYKEMNDELPDDTWSHLAKSRIIALER